jgi:hypothetical protein
MHSGLLDRILKSCYQVRSVVSAYISRCSATIPNIGHEGGTLICNGFISKTTYWQSDPVLHCDVPIVESWRLNNRHRPTWGGKFWAFFPYFEKVQEVLGKTNRLLSLLQHGPHWKRRVQQFSYCCVCIRYRGKVSTEPLPSNDGGIFTERLPSNDKGEYTDTDIHPATWSHKLTFIFFKISKVG